MQAPERSNIVRPFGGRGSRTVPRVTPDLALRLPAATTAGPLLGLALLPLAWGRDLRTLSAVALALVLAWAVLTAVHHAEVVAHRVGEPFGSLVLAVAVTVIEVGLILSLMLSGGEGTSTLARDTIFAAS